ncbi:MAG: DUF4258 domain-containing protein [Nitrososphaeria archaeon]|nr:DUF4258 domain-containing protein [Nitrososphaeria archaeon]
MNRIFYTSHAKIRLKVRNIDKSEVNRILKSPQNCTLIRQQAPQ